jgi:hypothetical protein
MISITLSLALSRPNPLPGPLPPRRERVGERVEKFRFRCLIVRLNM